MSTPHPDPGRSPGAPPSYAATPAPQVPPGWYPGPAGVPQWWDGRGWGPTAPPAADNSTTMGLLAYLGTFVGGFIVPLIVLMTEGRKNRFVKHHATEALNWSITVAMSSFVLVIVYVVAIVVGIGTTAGTGNASGLGVAVVFVVAVVILLVLQSVLSIVWVVMGAVAAGKRRYWRFPIAVRFVKGAASKEQVEALNRGGV